MAYRPAWLQKDLEIRCPHSHPQIGLLCHLIGSHRGAFVPGTEPRVQILEGRGVGTPFLQWEEGDQREEVRKVNLWVDASSRQVSFRRKDR